MQWERGLDRKYEGERERGRESEREGEGEREIERERERERDNPFALSRTTDEFTDYQLY